MSKVYHSMGAFRREFFPRAVERERREKIMANPKLFGEELAKGFLTELRDRLKGGLDG